jgi:class 3 adenylate cyclase
MSDIEDSTALLRRLGDRYGDVLHDVRAILRRAVSQARGREIDARADECFAVFEQTAAALQAAVAVQRALRSRTWPERLAVRVRIGIHSGHPTLTDAGYIGLAVHTAARVCSAAHGGQILASAETRAAVGDRPPAGIRFDDVGRHRLPGLLEPQRLFQVQARGLPATFPLPRTGRRAVPRRPAPPRTSRPAPRAPSRKPRAVARRKR